MNSRLLKQPDDTGADPTGEDLAGEAKLQRSAPEPLHQQISDRMRKNIALGVWPPHYKLKAEPELATDFGVSRGTLRRALRTLIEEGLLVQVQGKGTYVPSATTIEPPIAQDLLSLAEALEHIGVTFETEVLSQGLEVAPDHVQRLLDLTGGQTVFRLERFRSVEGVPVAYLVNYVRESFCLGIECYDYTQKTLFGVIEHEYHLILATGRRTFEAKAASQEVSKILHIPLGSPVLYLEQVVYLKNGQPIEYSDVWIRGDRLKLSSMLTRQ